MACLFEWAELSCVDVHQKKSIAEEAFSNEIGNHPVKIPQSLYVLFNGLMFIVTVASRIEVMQELNAWIYPYQC